MMNPLGIGGALLRWSPPILSLRSAGLEADDRPALESPDKYIAPPPVASDRLERADGGHVRSCFKRPWRSGTSVVDYPFGSLWSVESGVSPGFGCISSTSTVFSRLGRGFVAR